MLSYMNSSFIREIFDLCSILGPTTYMGFASSEVAVKGQGESANRSARALVRSRSAGNAETRCFHSPPRHHFRIAAL